MGIVSLPAIVGSCSEQGGATAPTSVSIATKDTGGFNNAVVVKGDASGILDTGSGFSGNLVTITLSIVSPDTQFTFYGYIRATGATTYQWNGEITDFNWPIGPSPSISGVASTSQDATSSGISRIVATNAPPSPGDSVTVEVDAGATNGSGTTSASTCTIVIQWL